MASGEASHLSLVSIEEGIVVDRPGPVPRFKDSFALSPDSNILYVVAFEESTGRQLFALDIATREILWRERLSNAIDQRRDRFGGMAVYGEFGIAVSPDGSRLFLATGERGGQFGIAVLDARTRDGIGFVGPFAANQEGLVTLPLGETSDGALLVAGRRVRGSGDPGDSLFFVNPVSLAVTDSVAPLQLAGRPSTELWQIHPSADGRNLYVLEALRLHRYDLQTRAVLGSTAHTGGPRGRIAVSRQSGEVFLTDPGDGFDFPGSGRVHVFSSSLVPAPPIDLRQALGGPIPTSNRAAVSTDGRALYVSSGTASIGPLFPTQPGRLFVIDLPSRTLTASVHLGGGAARQLFVF
ncbi:MAG: YncE family protein [Gemmatimonadaceae bacterium]